MMYRDRRNAFSTAPGVDRSGGGRVLLGGSRCVNGATIVGRFNFASGNLPHVTVCGKCELSGLVG